MKRDPFSGCACILGRSAPRVDDWRDLQRSIQPEYRFLASSWCEAWADSYLPEGNWHGPLEYAVVRDRSGNMLAEFPYIRYRVILSFHLLCIAGYYWPYRGLPIRSGDSTRDSVYDALGDFFMRSKFSCFGIRLGPVREGDAAVEGFLKAMRRRGWRVGSKRLGQNFEIKLPGSRDEFAKTFHGMIKRAAYYERRMRKLGALEIEKYSPLDRRLWPRVLEDLATIESKSWVTNEGGDPKFYGPKNRRFWHAVAEDDYVARNVAVFLLRFQEKPVSFYFTLESSDHQFILANSYAEEVKTHRTGSILACHVLLDAVDRGIRSVDWGMGDSGYKQRWGARPGHCLADHIVIPSGPVGYILRHWLARRAGYAFGIPRFALTRSDGIKVADEAK